MVLSNKKLKQKLRAAKAELLGASDAQTPSAINCDESVKSLLAQKAKSLPKRVKIRKNALPLVGIGGNLSENGGDGDVKKEEEGAEGLGGLVDVEKGEKKRKRDDEGKDDVERGEVKERKMKKMKKKKKKKKKGKKDNKEAKIGNDGEKEDISNGGGLSEKQFIEETSLAANSESSFDICMKVYVGGIPYYSTEDDIRSYFEGCGTITEMDCMKFPESGKFRGIAIITFRTEAAVKRALALDGSDMGGLFLKIQPYKSGKASKKPDFSPAFVEGYNRIYAGNLSWDITEEDLRKLFSSCNIKSIRFGEDKETGEFRGYAHVDFSDSLSLSMALKLDQTVVCGRPIRISCAVPSKEAAKKSLPALESAPSVPIKESVDASQSINTTPADGEVLPPVSGKIRRRTCYECGERGHLSSACPKKKAAEETNPV